MIREQESIFSSFVEKALKESIKNKPISFFNKYTIRQSSTDEDTKLSFDMVFSGELEVSVRFRKQQYIKYEDVTIRTRSMCGYKTEIDKLIEGMGHIYFYGWLNENETKIVKWLIYDINNIRSLLETNGTLRCNGDGTEFKAYDLAFLKENNSVISFGDNKHFYFSDNNNMWNNFIKFRNKNGGNQ